MLHGLQGMLLYSAHRRTTIDARSLLHQRRTSTASHQALGGGARGAGFDNTIVGFLQTATRLRRHHPLHSTGRRPAAGSGRLLGCCSLGGLLAPTTPSFARYGPQSGSRLLPVAGLLLPGARRLRHHHSLHSGSRLLPVALLRRAGRLAGSDDNILCTLRAAVRQSASAGCRAAARGEARWLRLHHPLHSAGRHPAAGPGRVQGCGAWGGSLAPTTPSSALCGPPSGSRLRPVAKLQRAGGSCSDDTMFCHLRAAVLQSASAGCWRVPPTALYALPPAL